VAHPDLDTLVNSLFPFAQGMLAKHGAFFPFGASLKSDGEVVLAAGDAGETHPESVAFVELLVDGFRKAASSHAIRAAGVCLDVRVVPPNTSKKMDAICARLEHAEGQCVDVYLPYEKNWLGRLKFGGIFSAPGEARIFRAG
jgi:hypothetical protein